VSRPARVPATPSAPRAARRRTEAGGLARPLPAGDEAGAASAASDQRRRLSPLATPAAGPQPTHAGSNTPAAGELVDGRAALDFAIATAGELLEQGEEEKACKLLEGVADVLERIGRRAIGAELLGGLEVLERLERGELLP